MTRPLDGIRIVDCTHVLAGPYCGYQLGLLGAEVIRIDRVDQGDFIRWRGPEPALNNIGLAPNYLVQNAGKKSLALDLKAPRGQEILKKLVATADVMTENFRPGKLASLGLGYDAMKEIKPNLVYCSLTGFGQTGDLKDFPAYDYLVQGVSGYMAVNGTEEEGPRRISFPIIDYLTGLVGAFAVTSALLRRERTGDGQYIDVTMLESALTMLGPLIGPLLISGVEPVNPGNLPTSQSPFSGIFDTKDGQLITVANTPKQVASLSQAVGDPDLAADPRLDEIPPHAEAAAAARQRLAKIFKSESASHWADLLNANSVPAGKLKGLSEVLADGHLATRGFLHNIPNVPGADRDIQVPGIGFQMPGQDLAPAGPPPMPGADSQTLLRSLGYSSDQCEEFASQGIVKMT